MAHQFSSHIPGYYTPAEVMERFNWTRQQLSATARREGWLCHQVGRANLYSKRDVDNFALARLRTDLLRQLGWVGRGLVRHDDWDTICPECNGFAVFQPGKNVQEEIQHLEAPTRPCLCENGHRGEHSLC